MSVTINEEPDSAFAEEAEKAVAETAYIRIGRFGAVQSISFPKRMRPAARYVYRVFAGRFQFVWGREKTASWTVKEQDYNGIYLAQYEEGQVPKNAPVGASRLFRKTKQKYLPVPFSWLPNKPQSSKLVKAKTVQLFFYSRSGLVRAQETEKLRIEASGKPIAVIDSTAQINLLSRQQLRPEVFKKKLAQARADMQGIEPQALWKQRRSPEQEAEMHAQQLGKRTIADIKRTLQTIQGDRKQERKQQTSSFLGLKALFYLEPDSPNEFLPLLAGASREDFIFKIGIGALGESGTEQAQEVLRVLLTRQISNREVVGGLISALTVASKPEQASIDLIMSIAKTSRDRIISDAAKIGLGTMVLMLRQSDPSRLQPIVDYLVAGLRSTTDPDKQEVWLRALGNAGAQTAQTALKPFFETQDTTATFGCSRRVTLGFIGLCRRGLECRF